MIKTISFVLFTFTSFGFAQLMGPKLVLQQSTFDFGNISQGEQVSHTFVLTNSGGDLLKINDVKASCGCTAAAPDKSELAPGESTNIVVTFNSKGRTGKQIKTVNIKTNDPEQPEAKLTISANVVLSKKVGSLSESPAIYFAETQHDFGKVNEGAVLEYTFKFENKGKSALKIKDISTSCGCTAALVSDEVLEPGNTGTLKVELDTKNREGKMSRTITIKSNDPKEPEKILTVYVDITKVKS